MTQTQVVLSNEEFHVASDLRNKKFLPQSFVFSCLAIRIEVLDCC